MSANSTHVHHAIDYIEFPVTDMQKAQAFYSAAFGWKFNDYGPGYCGIQREQGEAGGFRLDTKTAKGGPLVILYSKDLDATFAKVKETGVKIDKPPFEFPGGRRFEFEDPSGNALAVWSEK